MKGARRASPAALACTLGFASLAAAQLTQAQAPQSVAQQLQEMQQQLAEQRRLIDSLSQRVAAQSEEIARLRGQSPAATAAAPRAPAAAQTQVPATSTPAAPLPTMPVGSAPEPVRQEPQSTPVPQGMGVLTPDNRFVFTPSLEYSNSSSNRLVFRGIELIPGVQIGLIDASDASRNTLVAAASLRYGISDILEVDAHVPFLVRWDRFEATHQGQNPATDISSLEDAALGDVELGMRYQINRPVGERPIFVGSLRLKSNTGRSPYAVPFDEFGVATGLATGSGFWAIQPGVSFLLPSDPAVIFGGISYIHQLPRNIDRTIGGATVGRVDPGDAASIHMGFGFALNPRFSYSLGYRHNYISATRSRINNSLQRSRPVHAGSLNLGMSYRLTTRRSLELGLEIGATGDAPGATVTFRAPFASQ